MTPTPPFPSDQIVASLRASPPRRYLAVAITVTLGLLLIALGFSGGRGVLAQLVLIALGALALWQAARIWYASEGALYLTEAGLFDQDGTCLAAMDDVVSVSRGTFAIKPSGGFTLLLTQKRPRASAPGLWWRLGRRLGVGGVTGQGAARFMAEAIAAQIARR